MQRAREVYILLTQQQRSWAQKRAIAVNRRWSDYVTQLDDNLFQPLSSETLAEYEEGEGMNSPPRAGGKPPKLCALHSSAALVCNLFDYWRERDVGAIASACGAPPGCTSLCFEQKRPIRQTWKTPPHPDCEFQGPNIPVTAVESKFLEPYSPQRESMSIAVRK